MRFVTDQCYYLESQGTLKCLKHMTNGHIYSTQMWRKEKKILDIAALNENI